MNIITASCIEFQRQNDNDGGLGSQISTDDWQTVRAIVWCHQGEWKIQTRSSTCEGTPFGKHEGNGVEVQFSSRWLQGTVEYFQK